MTKSNLEIVLLHEHPEYLESCAVLLNEQWKRSLSARIQSLEKSFKDLPDSLLLIERSHDGTHVIGHSRLTRVLEDSNGCWIGSVVIDVKKRGKGYGKYLMEKSEEYAKQLNFTCAYLNTQDKQEFYEHLGYTYGEAVSSINFKSNIALRTSVFKPVPNPPFAASTKPTVINCTNGEIVSSSSEPPNQTELPRIINTSASPLKTNIGQYWMKKAL